MHAYFHIGMHVLTVYMSYLMYIHICMYFIGIYANILEFIANIVSDLYCPVGWSSWSGAGAAEEQHFHPPSSAPCSRGYAGTSTLQMRGSKLWMGGRYKEPAATR